MFVLVKFLNVLLSAPQAQRSPPRPRWCLTSCWWTFTTPRTTSVMRTRWCLSPALASPWSGTTSATTTTGPSWTDAPSTPGELRPWRWSGWSQEELFGGLKCNLIETCLCPQLPEEQHVQHLHRDGVRDRWHGPGPGGGLRRGEEDGHHPPTPGVRRARSW